MYVLYLIDILYLIEVFVDCVLINPKPELPPPMLREREKMARLNVVD